MMPDFKALIERIGVNEGYRSKVYKCTAGVDTVGIGFALPSLPKKITPEIALKIVLWQIEMGIISMPEDVCVEMVAKEISELHLKLGEKLDWYDNMPPEIQGVVIEMCYQMGFTGFCKFKKAIAHMKNKEFQLSASEMLDSRWAKQTPNRANRLADIVREHG